MDLIIKRSKWLHGEGAKNSFLLRRSDGKMCCLGFLGKACGATDEEILDLRGPQEARNNVAWPEGLLHGANIMTKYISCINKTDAFNLDVMNRFDRAMKSAAGSEEFEEILDQAENALFCTASGLPEYNRADELLKKIGF